MNTCKNCRWWDVGWNDIPAESNPCDCDVESGKKKFTIEYSVLDDSGLDMRLVTGQDFGCVHFEKKQPKKE